MKNGAKKKCLQLYLNVSLFWMDYEPWMDEQHSTMRIEVWRSWFIFCFFILSHQFLLWSSPLKLENIYVTTLSLAQHEHQWNFQQNFFFFACYVLVVIGFCSFIHKILHTFEQMRNEAKRFAFIEFTFKTIRTQRTQYVNEYHW